MKYFSLVITHSAALSVTTNVKYQAFWSNMKYFLLVITHSASPSVTTNAQNEAYWSNMIYFSLVITHSPAPSWTRNTQNWRITRNDQHLEDYKKLSTSGKFHSGALNVTTNIFSSSLKLLTVHGLWWWLRKLSFNMPHTCSTDASTG